MKMNDEETYLCLNPNTKTKQNKSQELKARTRSVQTNFYCDKIWKCKCKRNKNKVIKHDCTLN